MQPLRPFEPRPELAALQLDGEAIWSDGLLQVRFVLRSPANALRWPEITLPPARRDGLWQSTCFEAFIARPASSAYWEVNLAPNGDWNVYALSAYRENLRPAEEITRLPYGLRRTQTALELSFQLALNPWIPAEDPLELSLTAVLEQPGHGLSYWAWLHSAAQPDFHNRASFQLLHPQETSGGSATCGPESTSSL
ncbi:MAG: DOMON-like domain-containing protein [Cyanobacteria bacterium M_surface_7_m2_037]|nr:DOMON-like domain-containing protein [Cyanobacteria bacterium K_DeepCast_0m_m1_088]MBM5794750.1 DOMON-like domain-containing protein [Cyanobacteria bacterium M_surface_7_m2_037]